MEGIQDESGSMDLYGLEKIDGLMKVKEQCKPGVLPKYGHSTSPYLTPLAGSQGGKCQNCITQKIKRSVRAKMPKSLDPMYIPLNKH